MLSVGKIPPEIKILTINVVHPQKLSSQLPNEVLSQNKEPQFFCTLLKNITKNNLFNLQHTAKLL